MWLVRLRKPRAEPRRCFSRPLIASVGPLLVPGRTLTSVVQHPARMWPWDGRHSSSGVTTSLG
jgi:hypothetical protein